MLTPSVAFQPDSDGPIPGSAAFRIISTASAQHTVQLHDLPPQAVKEVNAYLNGDDGQADQGQPEWTEEDIVHLHWRLLQDINRLSDPATPLEEKLDTLAWVFSEPQLEALPFSFVNCLNVVGNSPLSPTEFFGKVDVQAIRDWIRFKAKVWIRETLQLYPPWVQELGRNMHWMARQLEKDPQWLNQQVKRHRSSVQADMFGMESTQ